MTATTSISRADLRVPRWIDRIAHVVPLLGVPSALWRFAMGFGIPVGFHGSMARLYEGPGWVTVYVTVLNALMEGAAFLTIGLVRPWGEVMPGWVPYIGGRRIPTWAAVVPAAIGVVVLLFLTTQIAFNWGDPEPNDPDAGNYPSGVAGVVMYVCYAPLIAWGPLLAVVTVAYCLRRTGRRAPRESAEVRLAP
jgi:hypothetical protein